MPSAHPPGHIIGRVPCDFGAGHVYQDRGTDVGGEVWYSVRAPREGRKAAAVTVRLRIGGTVWVVGAMVLLMLGLPGTEADPFHEHIMVGGTATDQLHVLAHHLYHRALPPLPSGPHRDQVAGEDPSRVVSVLSVRHGDAAVFSLGGAVLVETAGYVVPAPPLGGPVMIPPVLWRTVILLLPDPPPRWS